MMKLRIFDRDSNGMLAPRLEELVRTACAGTLGLEWEIVELDGAVGDITSWWSGGMVDLERHISDGNAVKLEANQLDDLAKKVAPAAWLCLVGRNEGLQIVLRLHDSTFWEVETDSIEALSRFERTFSDTRKESS